MTAYLTLVPALSLGALDTGSTIVIGMMLAAVVLVLWASRPSVIARYSVQNQHPDDTAARKDPDATASVPAETSRPA